MLPPPNYSYITVPDGSSSTHPAEPNNDSPMAEHHAAGPTQFSTISKEPELSPASNHKPVPYGPTSNEQLQ